MIRPIVRLAPLALPLAQVISLYSPLHLHCQWISGVVGFWASIRSIDFFPILKPPSGCFLRFLVGLLISQEAFIGWDPVNYHSSSFPSEKVETLDDPFNNDLT